MTKKLSKLKFISLVKNGPLVAIDIIVVNKENNILLGYRNNQPAMNTWFVPGGCVRKNETFEKAFKRITYDEIRLNFNFKKAKLLGIYEHFYENNFINKNFGTHYVVLAYKIIINKEKYDLQYDQHKKYKWFSQKNILTNNKVHKNTKNYIKTYL